LLGGLFKGILLFFLLDMGLVVGRRLREARALPPFLIGFAMAMPPVHAALALGAAFAAGLPAGDAFLLAVLVASASYIVVPAVVRYAIPEANPAYYFGMALAITFPLFFGFMLGDIGYGGRVRAGFARQALHAWRLEFTHPTREQPMRFTSPVPADMVALLGALGLPVPDPAEAFADPTR
jgi:hypothetical protein